MIRGKQPFHQSGAALTEHQATHEQLPLYATLIAQGQRPEEQYPVLAVHIARCQICRAELTDLLGIGVAVFTGEAPPATDYPAADLSFLPSRQQAKPWWVDGTGQLIVVFSEPLLNRSRPSALVGSMRGRLLYDYIQELGTIPGLNARIEVFASDQQPDMSCVRVYVEILSRDAFDQHGSTVLLHAQQLTLQGTTDDTGSVSFEPIPLRLIPQLRIEIMPAYDSPP